MRVIDVYVDGSYSKSKPNECTSALIILEDDKPVFAQRYIIMKPEFVQQHNVGGELWAAMSAIQVVQGLYGNGCIEVNLYYDYKGIRHFVTGPEFWSKPKTIPTQAYASIMQTYIKQNPLVKLNFWKVKSHSGKKWNEIVDQLTRGDICSEIKDVCKETMCFG